MTQPIHLPHMHHPQVIAMGMQPMGPTWLEPNHNPRAMRAHKSERRATLGDAVYALTPEGESGAAELAHKVFDCMQLDTQPLRDCSPSEVLWQASLQVHEDLVVMAPVAGVYTLVAASLCSPSHWRLPDKIGRPMARIHDPIPTIHQTLTPKIDRIFERLTVNTPVERYNWAVQEDDALFCWPVHHAAPLPADTPLFYRVERQTLTRLPDSGALAFTIRVHIHPLESLAAVPDALPTLLAAIDANPAVVQRYKNFPVIESALAKYRAMT